MNGADDCKNGIPAREGMSDEYYEQYAKQYELEAIEDSKQ